MSELEILIEPYALAQASYTRALVFHGLGLNAGKIDGTGRLLRDYENERDRAKEKLYDYINAKGKEN